MRTFLVLSMVCVLAVACTSEERKIIARGNVLFNDGKLGEALAEYRRAIEQNPAFTEGHVQLGLVLYTQRNYPEAIAAYEKALALDPRSLHARKGLGAAYLQLREFDKAAAAFRTILAEDEKNVSVAADLAKVYYAKGELDEAKTLFERMLRIEESDPVALYFLGDISRRQGRYDDALGWFKKLSDARPEKHEGAYGSAQVLAMRNDRDGALEALRRATERGLLDIAGVRRDPSLATLRGDPRFDELLKGVEEKLSRARSVLKGSAR